MEFGKASRLNLDDASVFCNNVANLSSHFLFYHSLASFCVEVFQGMVKLGFSVGVNHDETI